MSHHASNSGAPTQSKSDRRAKLPNRWPLYAAGAFLAVLILAYFDGGEESLRPIVQEIESQGGEQ